MSSKLAPLLPYLDSFIRKGAAVNRNDNVVHISICGGSFKVMVWEGIDQQGEVVEYAVM